MILELDVAQGFHRQISLQLLQGHLCSSALYALQPEMCSASRLFLLCNVPGMHIRLQAVKASQF